MNHFMHSDQLLVAVLHIACQSQIIYSTVVLIYVVRTSSSCCYDVQKRQFQPKTYLSNH